MPVYATNGTEVRIAVGGASPDTKEVRIVLAAFDVAPQAVQEIELVFGGGLRYTLTGPRLEQGPETDKQGRKWHCAWSYFNAPPAVWAALGRTGLKGLKHDLGTLPHEWSVGAEVAEAIINAVACVNTVLPAAPAMPAPPVAPAQGGVTAPVVVVSRVYSDTAGTAAEEPVFQPVPATPGDPDQLACMVQRLIAVPHGKASLRVGQRAISAVLHAFSDPLLLDTFKIITSTAEPPAYILEIVSHSGRLLFKEEILPSGFERAKPGDERRQLELDRLRAEAILGPWAFGRPMPMDLYMRSLERDRNGQIFSVSKEEVAALVQDPYAVTFSYFAEPELSRLLTYSKAQGKLVDLMPTYP